jgi:lysophospholipid acyltransferase (LPLAT)-like uncharacterized protein
MKKIVYLLLILIVFVSCTDYSRHKANIHQTITLKSNEYLVNANWHGENLWLLIYDNDNGTWTYTPVSNYKQRNKILIRHEKSE